ncbi:MAG: DUF4176 domain-containing protein [Clostridiales bacterium]|nr:DUF4176 domain-containing protein [Candidatus Scatonaster coprocaballi]
MDKGLLPIGTVVLLKESTKRIMIIGVLQKQVDTASGKPKLWDYSACYYPEGYMGPDQTFLFNNDQIERVFAIGYQDEEQFEFKVKIDRLYDEVLAGSISIDDEDDEQIDSKS